MWQNLRFSLRGNLSLKNACSLQVKLRKCDRIPHWNKVCRLQIPKTSIISCQFLKRSKSRKRDAEMFVVGVPKLRMRTYASTPLMERKGRQLRDAEKSQLFGKTP